MNATLRLDSLAPRWRRTATTALTLAAVAGIAAAPVLAQRGGPARRPSSLLVSDVTLIDATGAPARPHMSILIRDGLIAGVAPTPAGGLAADSVVDAAGLFAIPGLVDGHVHIAGRTWEQRTDQLGRTLRGGVTSVVEMAGDLRITADLQRAIAVGEVAGPTIYSSALMAGPAFFTDPRVLAASTGYTPGTAPWMQAITPQTDVDRAVMLAKSTGATAIKLYAALDSATVGRVTAAAHAQGLRVFAHSAVFPARPGDLVAAGVDLLAHTAYLAWEGSSASDDFTQRGRGDFLATPASSTTIARLLGEMARRGVALNPTLWVLAESQPADSLTRVRTPWMNEVTRRAQAAGVRIVAGTDNMFDANRDSLPMLHRELRLLVDQAGLTPMQAIIAATAAPAWVLGVSTSRGTIEIGKVADLVLLAGNPLDRIDNTRSVVHVIKDGRVVR